MRTNTIIALLTGIVIGATAVVMYENGKLIKSALDSFNNINQEDTKNEENNEQ